MELLSSSGITRLSRNPCNYTRTRMIITMFAKTHHLCPVHTNISYLFRDNFGTVLLFNFAYIKSNTVGDISLYINCCGLGLFWPLPAPQTRHPILFSAVRKCLFGMLAGCNRSDVETILLWRSLLLSLRHNYRAVVLRILLWCTRVHLAVVWNSP
jgi:hypothetical protein